jgi:DNA-binding FrmR family transcriptional regulator
VSGRRNDANHLRPALRQGSGLVDHQRVDFFHPLERLGILDQDTRAGAASHADHDRHGRGEAERARTGDDQHRDRGDEGVGETRLRAEHRPRRERDERDEDHRRHEPARDLVGEPLDRRARALRRRHHGDDARQHGVAPDLLGAHDEAAACVERAGDHVIAGFFARRHRLARDQRFIDRRAPFQHDAVDRDFFARAHAQMVVDHDHIERHLFVAAVRAHAPRRFRREIEQRPDRARRLRARAQFEHLPEQHQHGDDRRRFEINRDRAVGTAERRREQSGRERRDRAVEKRDAGAERDQGEHVEIAAHDRLPAAHEERRARPQYDRSGEGERDEVRGRVPDEMMQVEDVAGHVENKDRRREGEADPEPPRHVGEFRLGAGIGGRQHRLERHAADRATARADLPHVRMHRAGVERAFGRRRRRRPMRMSRMVVTAATMHRFSHAPALAPHTGRGYIGGMRKDIKASCLKRLQRIEGQVRGLARMVEDDRYCIDIVTQIAAVRAALRRAEEEILRDHVAHCVEGAIASGDKTDQRRKIAELMDVVGRAER